MGYKATQPPRIRGRAGTGRALVTGTMYKNLCAHHLKGFHQAMEALPPHARYTQAFVWTQPQRAGLLQHRAGRTASCVDQNHRAPVSRKNQQPERTEPWVEAAVPATAQSLHWRRARATHSCVTAPLELPEIRVTAPGTQGCTISLWIPCSTMGLRVPEPHFWHSSKGTRCL